MVCHCLCMFIKHAMYFSELQINGNLVGISGY
jgi:hypothetical protein